MSKMTFFDLWLASFIALSAVCDDPMIGMLSLVSAVLRVIGNGCKFFIIIGGKLMKIRNTIVNKLAKGVDILLVVGNMWGLIFYLLLSNEVWVYLPHQKPSRQYMPFSLL